MSGAGGLADLALAELLGWALAMARVLPVALLCPVLGGQLVPAPVRLAVAGAVALGLHPLTVPGHGLAAWAREISIGLLVGLAASLPFDAARIGGRLMDLVRGTSAEAALPGAGHRESALGNVLHQLLVSLALAGGAMPAMIRALGRSYLLLPGGAPGEAGALGLARLVGVALAAGLSIAAPVVALAWAVDAALGLALRASPGLPLPELAVPVRILGGAAVVWLSLGLVADRLLDMALRPPGWLDEVLRP